MQYIRLLTFYTGLVSPQTVLKVSSLANGFCRSSLHLPKQRLYSITIMQFE